MIYKNCKFQVATHLITSEIRFNQTPIQPSKAVTLRKTSRIPVRQGVLTDAMATFWMVVVDTSVYNSQDITVDRNPFTENHLPNLVQGVNYQISQTLT